MASDSDWLGGSEIVSFYEHWTEKPDTPEPDFTTHTDVTETTRDTATEETLTKEPSAEELKEWMAARPLEDFDSSWHQYMDTIVVPLTLKQYWNAFWADDAPYFAGAFDNNPDHSITGITNWEKLALDLEALNIHEQADLTRTITRDVKGNGYTSHTKERDDFFLLEENAERITIMTMTSFKGSFNSDAYKIWTKWEMMTPDPQSHQVVFRQTSTIKWNGGGRPWVIGGYLAKRAEQRMKDSVVGMSEFFVQSAEKYLEGLPDGPYEGALTLPEASDYL